MSSTTLYLALCPVTWDPGLALLSTRLSSSLQMRLQRYRSIEQRNQTILGRALLAIALRELGTQIELECLGRARDGSPMVPPGYFGSISHTDGVVGATAARGGPIGLDLELRWHSFRAAEQFLPHHACNHHVADCDCTARLWVEAEAIAKASCRKLFEDSVSDNAESNPAHVAQAWSVTHLELADGLLAAVASATPLPSVVAVWLTPSQLSGHFRP